MDDDSEDFIECAACVAQPGSPRLCPSCLSNRMLIGRLKRRLGEQVIAAGQIHASAQIAAHDQKRLLRAEIDDLAAERDELERDAEQHRLVMPREPFDVRCADALADEVALLVIRKVIDSRSPAADALLDYRNPPEGQAGRLAIAEDAAERWCRVATRAETNTAGAIAAWLAGYGSEPIDARLAAKGILDKKWKRA